MIFEQMKSCLTIITFNMRNCFFHTSSGNIHSRCNCPHWHPLPGFHRAFSIVQPPYPDTLNALLRLPGYAYRIDNTFFHSRATLHTILKPVRALFPLWRYSGVHLKMAVYCLMVLQSGCP